MKQKLFTFFLALVASVSAIYANEFTIGDLKYRIGVTKLAEDLTVATSFNKFKTQSIYGTQTWTCDSKYGAIMNGYVNKTYANEDWLVSPAIDLSDCRVAELTFSHAFGPKSSIPTTTAQKAQYTVWVSNDFNGDVTTATWTEIPISYGTSAWSYISTKVMIPAENLQKNCCIAWKYTCEDISATWEIKSVSIVANEAEVIGNGGAPSSVQIPFEVTYEGDTYSVIRIGDKAFRGCSSLKTLTIPNSVTSIGGAAFYGCSSLTSVTIPNSVTSIGVEAFRDCSSLIKTNYTGDIAGWCNIKFGDIFANPMCYSHNFYINDQEIKDLVIPNSVTSIGDYAFKSCSSLTSVTIPNSVTSIGYRTFDGCSSLTSVTIPNGVTSIGSSAFNGCSSLTSVTIPNGVTSIGDFTFNDCSSLTSVTIGESVTSIGKWAFDGCSRLKKTNYTGDIAGWCNIKFGDDGITCTANPMCYSHNFYINDQEIKDLVIPNSVDSIYDFAFYDCSSLNSVTIGESVTSIGNSAFYDCSSLTSITIPNSVTSIGSYAFAWCESLTSITIPESVTSIGGAAFRNCSSLTSVTIGNSVTSIEYSAFYDCSSLTSITCEAENPPTVGSDAFYNVSKSIPVYVPCGCVEAYKAANRWKDFTNIQEPLAEYSYSIEVYVNDSIMGTATVDYNTFCEGNQISATPNFGYHFVQWSDGNTDNPRTLELTQDTTLTAEFAQSFSGQCGDSLYWELIDTTLQITGKGEMYDYKPDSAPWKLLVSSIKVLTIAEDVTKLSQSFDSCSVLESIVWNAKNCADASSLETAPFYAIRSQITSFTFGENVEHIPAYLCDGMDKLTSMIIPNSVTSIGSSAFNGCSSLTSVILTALSEEEFCKGQGNSLLYSKGVRCQREIQINGTKVTKFTIPNGVTSIGDFTFNGCSSLTSITIPESVTSIGERAFESCSSLTSVTIPNSVTSIGKCAFYDCSSLTSITIPESVTSIGSSAFYECSSLTSVTFPESVTSIEMWTFGYCSSLTSITIPNSVTSIGNYAFWGCASLTSITIPNSVTSIGEYAFRICNNITSVTWNAKNYAIPDKKEEAPFFEICSQIKSFTFGEAVERIPAYLCYGMEKLTSVTIPNSVKTIGTSAFEGCARLGEVSLGTGLEEIAANAFAGCTRLYDIYVYATYPPFAEESSFANYNVYVYVPCEYQRGYTLDVVWGKFKFIECIDSEDATTDGNVTVVPGFNDVTITWPTAENADSYSLAIKKADEPVCTLTFNQDGQLLNIAFAPSRDGNNHPAQYAAKTVSGYRFTVTGLTEATQYAYNITTKDADNNTIATYSGEFTTMGGSTSAVEDILQNTTNVQKLLRNGQLLILRDGKTYNAMGQEL